ncbi:MAG: hypothetical protein V7L25_32275 [Nostoc sp.]|uniref:hypothetical protein n=1 Tax=Nostoc sp. TaxID=1180 RepID=UPI002FEE9344
MTGGWTRDLDNYVQTILEEKNMDIDRLAKNTQFSKTDQLSEPNISEKNITFEYQISAKPSWQWWVIYRGVMPDWNNLNKNIKKDENWKYFSPDNPNKSNHSARRE